MSTLNPEKVSSPLAISGGWKAGEPWLVRHVSSSANGWRAWKRKKVQRQNNEELDMSCHPYEEHLILNQHNLNNVQQWHWSLQKWLSTTDNFHHFSLLMCTQVRAFGGYCYSVDSKTCNYLTVTNWNTKKCVQWANYTLLVVDRWIFYRWILVAVVNRYKYRYSAVK